MAQAENDMRAKIMAIMRDDTLTDVEKSKKRQELLTSKWTAPIEESSEEPGARLPRAARGDAAPRADPLAPRTSRACRRWHGRSPTVA
jgi:hypothetical protein